MTIKQKKSLKDLFLRLFSMNEKFQFNYSISIIEFNVELGRICLATKSSSGK